VSTSSLVLAATRFVTQMFCPPARISTPRSPIIPHNSCCTFSQIVVDRLLDRQRLKTMANGRKPLPVSLGTDNIKTYGESPGSVMWMCTSGTRCLGSVNKLELISLQNWDAPRIDVVINCSGVFRDLFINQMNLLDQGVKWQLRRMNLYL